MIRKVEQIKDQNADFKEGQGVDVPMPIIFIGAISGMMLSGIIGLFVGAVVMVLGYTLFSAWLKQPISSEELEEQVTD